MNFTYSYLVWSLILFFSCMAGYYFFPRDRNKIFLSAFLSIPAAFTAVLFVPEYWNPIRIIKSPIGIEDLLFSFATGGIVWIIVCFSVGRNFSYNLTPRTVIKRYLLLVAVGVCFIFILFRSTKWGVMVEALIGIIIVGLMLLVRFRFKAWRIAAAGSILFTLYYFIITGFVIKLFPSMILYWNNNNSWGIFIFNIPFEEIAWAIGFGAVWPLAMAYVFDLDLSDPFPASSAQ